MRPEKEKSPIKKGSVVLCLGEIRFVTKVERKTPNNQRPNFIIVNRKRKVTYWPRDVKNGIVLIAQCETAINARDAIENYPHRIVDGLLKHVHTLHSMLPI